MADFRMTLELPDDLRKRVEDVAVRERRSRNAQIVRIIEEWLEESPDTPEELGV